LVWGRDEVEDILGLVEKNKIKIKFIFLKDIALFYD
jgi:hypothetical protein